MESGMVGGMLIAGRPRVVEVEVPDLVEAMRTVVHAPERAASLGAAASRRIRSGHTWAHTAEVAAARLRALAGVRAAA
jgi:hypothetical protein